MDSRNFTRLHRFLSIASLAVLLLLPLSGVALAGREAPTATAVTEAVALPAGAAIVMEADATRSAATDAYPNIESRLAQMMLAARAGDREQLATFSGERHLDVAAGTARVILEMGRSPEAHAVGGPTYEIVALPNGRTATIEHAPRIAIRPELAAAIAATGATYELAVDTLVQVLAPLDTLEALSKLADVAYVRLPYPAQQQELPARPQAQPFIGPAAPQVGAQTSEGVSLTGTAVWHTWPSDDGTGINLAVFDFGFTGYAARMATGDLPAGAVLKDYSAAYSFSPDTAGNEHGAACAEIAYDMAPDATVYLYAWDTDAEFASAVDDYRNNVTGKRVATMSISFVNAGPYDGTGTTTGPTTKVNQAQASGIFWANAAGNYQTQHYSWTSARYSTTNAVAFGTGNVEGIGPLGTTNLWNIASGTVLSFYLEWNDWNATRTGDQSNIDYDLYLIRYTGSGWTQVASSAGNQCTASVTPTEAIAYTVPAGGPYNYGLVIQRYVTGCTNNFGHWMQLFTFNGFYTEGTGMVSSFWYANACNSLTIPADADGAVATGATFWGEDGNAATTYGLETFSSQGPRNASGGTNPGTTVNKPDVVAPDGVSTATYGASNNQPYRTATSTGFWGTSAAAPHVAGIAATYWETYPSYTLAQLRNVVQTQALYKTDGGTCGGTLLATGECAPGTPDSGIQNNRFGWGRINRNPPSPQAVTLAGFSATAAAEGVTLAWETVSETENAGFNVYRADSSLAVGDDGSSGVDPLRMTGWVRVNETLIPALTPGSTQGNAYTWTDAAAPTGTTWYMLEDVDLNGAATRHEPVSVTVAEPNAVGMAGFGAAGTALPALGGLGALALAALAGAAARKRR